MVTFVDLNSWSFDGTGWDMKTAHWPDPASAISITATTTGFTFDYGDGRTDTFTGSGFTYDANHMPITGVITDWTSTAGGNSATIRYVKLADSSPGSFPAATFTKAFYAHDWAGLMNQMLAGGIDITGTENDDVITGGNGDDVIAVSGSSFHYPTIGNDIVDGGAGNDTATFYGPVAMTIDLRTGIATGGGQTTHLTSIENIQGSDANDVIIGDAGVNWINGGKGDDIVDGMGGNDQYDVDSEFDVVNESLSGAAGGIDTVGSSAIRYTLGANIENLVLAAGAGLQAGGTGESWGTGNDLNNVITGNFDINTLDGGKGNDTLIGGKGDDTYIVDSLGDKVVEYFGKDKDTIEASLTYSLAALPNIENLTLTGTGNFNGTGNEGSNTIIGNDGDNILDGGKGNDILKGGKGNDTYIIEYAGDTIVELAGEGSDTVQAGFGDIDLNDASYSNIENATLTGTKAFNLTGTADDNALTGNTAANTLIGGDGDDTLNGGGGKDALDGGDGDDTYVIDSLDDSIQDTSGNDTVQSAKLSLDLTKSQFSMIENAGLIGTAALNLTGNGGDNVLTGNDGANILDGNGGKDTLRGGKGNDTYIVDSADDIVDENVVDKGIDLVKSSVSFDLADDSKGKHTTIENLTLTGTDNINGTGNDLANAITGNAADNRLNGGAGNDTLTGGLGDDTYVVDSLGDKVVELAGLASGKDTVEASITYSLAALANVENLTLTGTGNINATGNATANVLTGNDGDNVLDGGAGVDKLYGGKGDDTYVLDNASDEFHELDGEGSDTVKAGFDSIDLNDAKYAFIENATLTGTKAFNLTGTSGDNILTGNTAANTLIGGNGNDTLDGGGGKDILNGGDGDDTYIIDSADDTVTDTAGNDTVQSGKISINMANWAGIENAALLDTAALNIIGNSDDNVLTGNDGANTLDGNGGKDMLRGGKGNDTYIVHSTDDIVDENVVDKGIDLVKSEVSFDLADDSNGIHSTIENLTLTGKADTDGTGNDLANVIAGNTGNNVLTGGAGNDSLIGGDGDDTLDGGVGTDTLTGGKGDDVYIVDAATDKIIEAANQGSDTVKASATYSLAALANVENLILTGSADINGTGNAAVNQLTGNDGDNVLDGGAGADQLIGGKGNDTYILDNAGDSVTELAGEGIDTIRASFGDLDLNDAKYANIENASLTGTKAGKLTGTAGDNVLTGNTAANTLTGGDGNDTLDGGGGKDILNGGDGDDTYIIDSADDTITDSAGTDEVQSGKVSINMANWAGIENATLTGTAALNITGNSGDNVLTGNDSANTLDGNGGQDILRGGKGGDTYIVDSSDDVVDETGTDSGIDLVKSSVSFDLSTDSKGSTHTTIENLTLTGSTDIDGTGNALANVITGNSGDNKLDGGDGNDSLNGGDGDDTLDGGSGIDTLTGGKGDDICIVDSASDKIVETANQGTDTVQASFTYSLASLANVENLTLTGSADINGIGNAGINTITGNAGDNVLDGGAGADHLIGGAGDDIYILDNAGDTVTELANDGTDTIQEGFGDLDLNDAKYANVEKVILTGTKAANLTGAAGNDFLTGNAAANTLTGGAGNDTLDGGGGKDILNGGDGNDTYIVDSTDDSILDSSGNDTVQSAKISLNLSTQYGGAVENATLTGTAALNLTGTSGANLLIGNDGANILDGNGGKDTLRGGKGNDTYIVDSADDTVIELANEGTDLVQSSVTFSLASLANIENLTLTATGDISGTGNSLANTITGNSGDNTLDGGDGDDTLIGGAGNDTLISGTGNDTMTGGDGADVFVLQSIAYAGQAGAVITDFTQGTGGDLIDLGDILSILGTPDDAIAKGYFSFVYVGNDTIITADYDGSAGSGEGFTVATVKNVHLTIDDTTLPTSAAGDDGDNTLHGNGHATLAGGKGDDTYIVSSTGDTIVENPGEGTDTVQSSVSYSLAAVANVENLTLTDTWSALNGTGNDLDNVITGNDKDNVLDGGVGDDTLIGGAGNDTYIVDSLGDTVIDTSGWSDTVQTGSFSLNVSDWGGIENLTLTGSGNLSLTGDSGDNILTGNDGNNTIIGGDGYDTLNGGGGTDVLTGGAAGTRFDGGAGDDIMTGGTGNDMYVVDSLNDVIIDSGGIDTIVTGSFSLNLSDWKGMEVGVLAGAADLNLTGTSGDDALYGNNGQNVLTGGDGNDLLDGTGGTDGQVGSAIGDVLIGGKGNDEYRVNSVNDTIVENANEGDSDLVYARVSFSIASLGNIENIWLAEDGYMQDLNINATGNAGNNNITGNSGINVIDGGAGDDWIDGGAGDDILTGGAGQDYFSYWQPDETGTTGDIITDFTAGVDKIDIFGILQQMHMISTGTYTDLFAGGYVKLVSSGNDTLLQIDADGSAGSGKAFTLLTAQNSHLTSVDIAGSSTFGGLG